MYETKQLKDINKWEGWTVNMSIKEIVKRELTTEDIDFLKNLQNEMNTQDTVCQASPRFWVVAQEEWIITDDEYCEETHYFKDGEDYGDFPKFLNRLIDTEEYEDSLSDLESIDDFPQYIQDDFYEKPVRKEHVIQSNTFFLTKKEAEEHIRRNHYHYNETVHTYAMTAWRSPEVEKLYELLEKIDWEVLNKLIIAKYD